MIPIIQEKRNSGFLERLGRGSQESLPEAFEELLRSSNLKKENTALRDLGIDIAGVHDPEIRKSIVSQSLKHREDKSLEKESALQSIKGTIGQLRSLVESEAPGVGFLGKYSPAPEAFYNRAKLRTLGSDLLSFYKSLFPRGITQQEFIRLEKDYIPKPGDTLAEVKGKLDAFEDLINRKLHGSEGKSEEEGEIQENSKTKFDISNPEHKAKRDQLLKKFKGNREKAKEALSREFEE